MLLKQTWVINHLTAASHSPDSGLCLSLSLRRASASVTAVCEVQVYRGSLVSLYMEVCFIFSLVVYSFDSGATDSSPSLCPLEPAALCPLFPALLQIVRGQRPSWATSMVSPPCLAAAVLAVAACSPWHSP